MRTLLRTAILFLLASHHAHALSKAQLKLYNRLPDADWYVLHLSDHEMVSVNLKRLPTKEGAVYQNVWVRWDVVQHELDAGTTNGFVLDIDCENRRTLEKVEITYDNRYKRENPRVTNVRRDWTPKAVATEAYEVFCAGIDRAVDEWEKRTPVTAPAETERRPRD